MVGSVLHRGGHWQDELAGAPRPAGAVLTGAWSVRLDATLAGFGRGLLWMAWSARGALPDRGDARRIGLILCLMVITQIYVTGSVDSWTAAGAFGQRRFVGLTVVWIVGLAAALQAVRGVAVRRALWTACALSVWWNLGLMAQFGANLMDRQRLQLSRNAYNTFVVVPLEAPRLAYRYLFDRSSFYRTRPD